MTRPPIIRIPGSVGLDALPPPSVLARRRIGLSRPPPSPRIVVRERLAPTTYEMAGVVDPSGGADALPPEHFLHYRQYASRPFIVAEGRDVLTAQVSKAIAAPDHGLVDEFNVSGGMGVPQTLLAADFAVVPDGLSVADRVVKRVPGLSIPFCHYGQDAFGHFVLDGLLQVYLFRRELADGARLAHWLPPLPWIDPVLQRAGVPARSRRPLDAGVVLLERAGLSSALAGHGVYMPDRWSLRFFDWLRAVFLDGARSAGRERLYVRRKPTHSRRILNASDLETLVGQHGFRLVTPEDYPFADQVRLFAEAGTVLSPWGSTLTLSPMLGGPRRVIELLPTSVTDPWFVRQAAVHGLAYTPFMHASSPEGDLQADLPRLDRWLGALRR